MEDQSQIHRLNTKPWIKFHTEPWLTGTTRQDFNYRQRSVFLDLICLAKRKDGIIEIENRKTLAMMLLVPLKLLNETIEKCAKTGKFVKISTSAKEAFLVDSWKSYQG
jgi:hypothetical protein